MPCCKRKSAPPVAGIYRHTKPLINIYPVVRHSHARLYQKRSYFPFSKQYKSELKIQNIFKIYIINNIYFPSLLKIFKPGVPFSWVQLAQVLCNYLGVSHKSVYICAFSDEIVLNIVGLLCVQTRTSKVGMTHRPILTREQNRLTHASLNRSARRMREGRLMYELMSGAARRSHDCTGSIYSNN